MKHPEAELSKCIARQCAFLFIFLGLVFGGCATHPAQRADVHDKAMLVYRFGQFIEWPAPAFATPKSPLIIGVMDAAPLERELRRIAWNKNLNGHPLVVRRETTLAVLSECRILFIGSADKKKLPEIFDALGNAPVLTVGETDDFLETGGMINFVAESGHVRFDAAPAAAQKAGLKMSSQLLTTARRIL